MQASVRPMTLKIRGRDDREQTEDGVTKLYCNTTSTN